MEGVFRRWWRRIRAIWSAPAPDPASAPACSSRSPSGKPENSLLHASQIGDIDIVKLLAMDAEPGDIRAAMWAAAHHGRSDIAEALLQAGAARNLRDISDSALNQAAMNGHVRIIKLIAKYTPHAFLTENAARALRNAAVRADSVCVRALLRGGTPVSAQIPGAPPALFAAARSNVDCVAVLLEAGADPNETDEHGRTPLHYAALADKSACARLLLSNGAYMHMDNLGCLPVDYAGSEYMWRLLSPLHLQGA